MYNQKTAMLILSILIIFPYALSGTITRITELTSTSGQVLWLLSPTEGQLQDHKEEQLEQLNLFFKTIKPVLLHVCTYNSCDKIDFLDNINSNAQDQRCYTTLISLNPLYSALYSMLAWTQGSVPENPLIGIPASSYMWTIADLEQAFNLEYKKFTDALTDLPTNTKTLFTCATKGISTSFRHVKSILLQDLACHSTTPISFIALKGYIQHLKERATELYPSALDALDVLDDKIQAISTSEDFKQVLTTLDDYGKFLLSLQYNYKLDERYITLKMALEQSFAPLKLYTLAAKIITRASKMPLLICLNSYNSQLLTTLLTEHAGYSIAHYNLSNDTKNILFSTLYDRFRPLGIEQLEARLTSEEAPFYKNIAALVAQQVYAPIK
ncbi:hypothetical protein H0X48_00405 [Candidatus Dependentiae bacterium]|nr:hypothetical protein [Candidatus Dependentiae bacterium]